VTSAAEASEYCVTLPCVILFTHYMTPARSGSHAAHMQPRGDRVIVVDRQEGNTCRCMPPGKAVDQEHETQETVNANLSRQ
jgi:hypothetical protein